MNNNTYPPGTIITSYVDPVSCRIPEGEIILLNYHTTIGFLEYWEVQFITDKYITKRWIKQLN